MADAHGSGPCVRKDVGVQLPPCPPIKVRISGDEADLLTVAVGTGVRFGELTALWVSDIDLKSADGTQ
jgi:hypothetical protein